jgi:hypothetical protein
MAVTVKKAVLWRKEVDNRPGVLASTLAPLAEARADLTVVMGYRFPGMESQGAIEVYPVSGKKVTDAASAAGLQASAIPTLVVEGDNRPGLGHAIAKAIADEGINLSFVLAQVMGRRYSAVFGFENDSDATRAAVLMKKATSARAKQ